MYEYINGIKQWYSEHRYTPDLSFIFESENHYANYKH